MDTQPQDLLIRLVSAPPRIARAVDGLSEDRLRASDDSWAYRVYALRTRDDTPTLLAFDERRWAGAVRYPEADFHTPLQLFTLRRAEMVNMLRRIEPHDWQRSGQHEQLGPISVLDVVTKIVEHEEEHCAQIENPGTLRR